MISFSRIFTEKPYSVNWIKKDAILKDGSGNIIFEQKDVEFPDFWSQTAINIVASKYFREINGVKENSLKQLIKRVLDEILDFGIKNKYFDEFNGEILYDELEYALIHQYFSFNSPVWFNLGFNKNPQLSACFIQDIKDSIDGIIEREKSEILLFRQGSGSGINFSSLRSSYEKVSKGGYSSGPVSFMQGFDSNAGAISSGGVNRRAAKMAILNVDHPDIYELSNGSPGFITCKAEEEKKAHALINAGWSNKYNDPTNAYATLQYQNANNSVRVTNSFMEAVKNDSDWHTLKKDGSIQHTYKARFLFDKIAEAAHFCGDPGIQFHDTINDWNTCKASGTIEASNPCCLHGDTLIDTDEGRIPIKELTRRYDNHEPLPNAFCWDIENNTPKVSPILAAWKSGSNQDLVSVTIKGITINVTPDHKFLTYNRSKRTIEYVMAKDLKPGMEIKIINRYVKHKKFVYIRRPSKKLIKEFDLVYECLSNSNLDPNFEIEPLDNDFRNSSFKNLKVIPKVSKFYGVQNDNHISISDYHLAVVYQNILRVSGRVTRGIWNGFIERMNLKGKIPTLNHTGYRGLSLNDLFTKLSTIPVKSLDLNQIPLKPKVKDKNKEKIYKNSKRTRYTVESVKPFPNKHDVYNITVDKYHNFGVSDSTDRSTSSVIVKNSEYHFLNNTACNLASIKLTSFVDRTNPQFLKFKIDEFKHMVNMLITVQDMFVDLASYPTKQIDKETKKFRALGLGYSDLGALIMGFGFPYDSKEGRTLAAGISALLTSQAYIQSSLLGAVKGPFKAYNKNKDSLREVIAKHYNASNELYSSSVKSKNKASYEIENASHAIVAEAFHNFTYLNKNIEILKFRNSQVTVLAPTGTIGFMMDCSTTGIEPELALVKYKSTVDGGFIKLVNTNSVEAALRTLNYSDKDIKDITDYILEHDTIEGCNKLNSIHLPVFDCSIKAASGKRFITPEGHVNMLAAVQPFISGSISKTVNLPSDATINDVKNIFTLAWEKGCKCITVYRDGCKAFQPVKTDKSKETKTEVKTKPEAPKPTRKKPPISRPSVTHKFNVGGLEGYLIAGFDPESYKLIEIFITANKIGSSLRGMLDAFATSVSIGLQYGAPFSLLYDKFSYSQFEPNGFTPNKAIPRARSILDYIFRYLNDLCPNGQLSKDYFSSSKETKKEEVIILYADNYNPNDTTVDKFEKVCGSTSNQESPDAPPCLICGTFMVRNGTCFKCPNCGETSGCS